MYMHRCDPAREVQRVLLMQSVKYKTCVVLLKSSVEVGLQNFVTLVNNNGS